MLYFCLSSCFTHLSIYIKKQRNDDQELTMSTKNKKRTWTNEQGEEQERRRGGRKNRFWRKIHIDRFLLSTVIKRGFAMEELKEGKPWYANEAAANQSNKISLPNWDEERLHYLGRVSCLITRNGIVIHQWCNCSPCGCVDVFMCVCEKKMRVCLFVCERKRQKVHIDRIKHVKDKVRPCLYVCVDVN